MEQYTLELQISEQDREKGHEMAEDTIEEMIAKVKDNIITHSQLTGYLWEMRAICDELIEAMASQE
jgi:hypothetical protein